MPRESVYTILNERPSLPIVVHIPHAGTVIPPAAGPAWMVSAGELEAEVRALTDWYTDELYEPFLAIGGTGLRYGYSRLVLDPERFDDDGQEIMAERRMGVIYTHGARGTPLRRAPTPAEREALLETIYRPYHATLESLVAGSLERFGRCVIIDGHSYPAAALPYELHPLAPRPAVCLGTLETEQSPETLVKLFEETVRGQGLSVARNAPFAGSIMPARYVRHPAVSSIMIETNRGLYLDAVTARRTAGFPETVALMRLLAEDLAAWLNTNPMPSPETSS